MSLESFWPSLFSIYGASLIAFLSPGPNFVGIVSSAVQSRRSGIMVAIGVSLGTTFWATMAVTGITALLEFYSGIGLIMRFIGGSYLIWLGAKSLRSAFMSKAEIELLAENADSPMRSFYKGLLIQLSNPKTALFWLSLVSVVLLPNTPAIISILIVLGTTLIALVWHLILALGFSHPRTRAVYLNARSYISFAFGLAFVALGSGLIIGNFINS